MPKDPRLCKNEDHIFCLAHVSRHLENSQSCPYCRDPLTLETLRRPTGFLKKCLHDLKIKCDHHDRGCPDVVRLEDLPRHVAQCEFAPVMCGNEGCEMVVNKREKENHEKNLCQIRNVKYHDYAEIKASQDEMKASLDEIKANQDELKQSVDEMKQQLQTMMRMFNQALHGSNVDNTGAQATKPPVSVKDQDIIILGGRYALGRSKVSNTVENFNIVEEKKSTELPRMKRPRTESASCIYNGCVMVTGGFDGQDGTDLIEMLKMTQHPLRWTMFGGKLPVKLSSHSSIIYINKLYVIGGHNWNQKKTSDIIYELNLVHLSPAKALARMPQARRNHRAEIVNGKIFIVGGTTELGGKDTMDSVVVYDFITNDFNPSPSLPKAVCDMSTVTLGNKIIVIGGVDKNEQVLNDVIIYDTETGDNKSLPSLKHKRRGSSAVIIDDVIVVFGGWNKEQGHLNSVESFTMGSDGWKELPGMKEKREFATAVVLPRI